MKRANAFAIFFGSSELLPGAHRRAKLDVANESQVGHSSNDLTRGTELKENPVKRALQAGKPQIGTWLTLGSIAGARLMARAGFPWLTVDMEHTHTDIQTATYMFAAIADAGCVPLARIPANKHEYIKMVLDCGPWESSPRW